MSKIRRPAVAGQFYPDDAVELRVAVETYLAGASPKAMGPKAIVAPHAGYIYSGPIAASAYACIAPLRELVRRVVLLGPAHRVYLEAIAPCAADAFATPLGDVEVDGEAVDRIRDLPQVVVSDLPHVDEHSLEVHLPFLQVILDRFKVVPMVVGDVPPQAVAQVLERLWDGVETLIVVSSDLTHFLDYDTARAEDLATCRAIEALRYDAIDPEHACGCRPLNGLLYYCRTHGLGMKTLDYCNSGDTAGTRNRVVGYGAYAST